MLVGGRFIDADGKFVTIANYGAKELYIYGNVL